MEFTDGPRCLGRDFSGTNDADKDIVYETHVDIRCVCSVCSAGIRAEAARAHSADGLEQLGLVRHQRDRRRGEGQCRLHGRSKLAKHGWQYIVVDIQWSEPNPKTHGYRPGAELVMDANGRLMPAPNRFPSAADGQGLQAARGLRACEGAEVRHPHHARNSAARRGRRICRCWGRKVKASRYRRTKQSICRWNSDMYGVDVSQARRTGILRLHREAVRLVGRRLHQGRRHVRPRAGRRPQQRNRGAEQGDSTKTGRPIVLSLSPGTSGTAKAAFIGQHAQMWRISDDFWDRWVDLKRQFPNFTKWNPYVKPGNWPDGDMLPLGHIGIRAERGDPRMSLLTKDEQRTLMTLWSIARSPLMFGGHLPDNDEFTLEPDHQRRSARRQSEGDVPARNCSREANQVAWVGEIAGLPAKYLAVFNTGDTGDEEIEMKWSELGLSAQMRGPRSVGEEGPRRGVATARRSRWRRTPWAFYRDHATVGRVSQISVTPRWVSSAFATPGCCVDARSTSFG